MGRRGETGNAVAIEFRDTVKAQVTQAVLSALLERGGYRVTRFGIEELFGEVKLKERGQYQALELPEQLRYLPDLLVVSLSENRVLQVEVKFRRSFTARSARGLYEVLNRQRRYWPDSYAILLIAQPFAVDARFHQDYIRVLPPGHTGKLIDETLAPQERWKRLPHLPSVFKAFSASVSNQALVDFVTRALRGLGGL
jgi:hypothetical protein